MEKKIFQKIVKDRLKIEGFKINSLFRDSVIGMIDSFSRKKLMESWNSFKLMEWNMMKKY